MITKAPPEVLISLSTSARRNDNGNQGFQTLLEDIDGSKATETIRFAFDGIEYEIDVPERNANRLRNSLQDFIAHGHKVGGRRTRKTASSGPD